MPKRQVFVQFMSPGTIVDEVTDRPMESADPAMAVKVAAQIRERHGARPYGFRFYTRIVADDVDDGEGGKLKVQPKTVAESGTHFIDGAILNFEEVPSSQQILRSNMRGNLWPLVVETTNGYRHTSPFTDQDCVVDSKTGAVTRRGADPDLAEYRRRKVAEWGAT